MPYTEPLPDCNASLNNIQHISERECADSDDATDPSQHPMAKTIFMERSKGNFQNLVIFSQKISHQRRENTFLR